MAQGASEVFGIEREVAVRVAAVVLAHAKDDDDAKMLIDILLGPPKQWWTCPVCRRRYETVEEYERQCGNRDTWGLHGAEGPRGRRSSLWGTQMRGR